MSNPNQISFTTRKHDTTPATEQKSGKIDTLYFVLWVMAMLSAVFFFVH